MEKVLEQALPEVTKTEEPALPLPSVESEGGGFPVGSIAGVIVAAAVIYLIGRVYCKK